MQTDRERAGYKGPVREVTLDAFAAEGRVRQSWLFDRNGALQSSSWYLPDGTQSRTSFQACDLPSKKGIEPSGCWREEVQIPVNKNLVWGAIEGLPDIGFPTFGATSVVTHYDPQDRPVRIVFRDADEVIISEVQIMPDEHGRPHELRQLGRASESSPLGRVVCNYDAANNLNERIVYLGDSEASRTTWTFNESGDRVTETEQGSVFSPGYEVRFEYEYDQYGNWTRMITQRESGVDEMRRCIQYFSEESPDNK